MRERNDVLLTGVRIGSVVTRNRVVRAGTAETMADAAGGPTPKMLDLYRALADGSAGAAITGHMFVSAGGQASPRQLGIHTDELIPGLRDLTKTVHIVGMPIFAQLAHAGSQSRMVNVEPLAPSMVPNPLTGREFEAASEERIQSVISDFAEAARRAVEAGFDGVHVHGANGYLISQFCSPLTNKRNDRWGGSAENRTRFPLSIVEAIRAAVPRDFPVMFKIGMADAIPNGLDIEESMVRAVALVATGVDAFEVSCGLMSQPSDSAARFVGLSPLRAIKDLIWPTGFSIVPEGTFRLESRSLKERVQVPVMVTGGVRTPETMREIIDSGGADLVGLSRPFIRQPDLVSAIARGSEVVVACTSCNLCLEHSGVHELRCWRNPKRRLVFHTLSRIPAGISRRNANKTK